MANIIRWNPFDETFDDFFKGMLARPFGYVRENAPVQFTMDVTESDNVYRVKAEIPGVKKDDINVTINGNQVAISAEVKHEKEVKDGEKLLHSERYFGKVYRVFSLGQDVDEASAEAKYTEGVLELTLPKKAVASAKKLTIN